MANPGVRDVQGRIRMPFIEDDDASDFSDDQDDLWLEYSDDGGGRVRSKKPRTEEVTIENANGGKYKCKGRFPLTDAYWTVNARIHNGWMQSVAYSIHQDSGLKSFHVTLFLDECIKSLEPKIRLSLKACFDVFCSENLGDGPLSFFNLEGMLDSYLESESQMCSLAHHPNMMNQWQPDDHGKMIEKCVFKSDLGVTGLRAVSHPELVGCVSTLLPFSFQDFLCKLDPVLIDEGETIAVASPWEFGFRQIIHKKLKLNGTEAYLSTYEKAGYMARTPIREKDALYIYEVLKVDSQQNGHMYMPFQKLCLDQYYFGKLNYKITSVARWKAALDYMEENEVIVREEFDRDVNIFLYHNWKAEVDTVKGLSKVLKKYQLETDSMDVDFSSPDFDKIRRDPDQLKASRLIAYLPVTVLSGMGGCGKTTVVTNLLKHVCDRYKKEIQSKNEIALEEGKITQEMARVDVKGGQDQNDKIAIKEEEMFNRNMASFESGNIKEDFDTKNKTKFLLENSKVKTLVHAGDLTDVDLNTNCPEDGGSGNEEQEKKSSKVESKDGRLHRELMEDLLKMLKDRKSEECDEMKVFKRQILLVAPTGKAARLLGCKAKLPSATIHSVIISWRMWREREKKKDQEPTEWMYDHVKILVVDECSLMSVSLFAAVLNILIDYGKLSKVVLLGDIKQLPSIQPGDFLRGVFKTFSKHQFGFSVELTQNHRSESKLIIENAKRISERRMPKFDPDERFYFVELKDDDEDNERDQAISRLLKQNTDIQCQVQSQFVSFRNAHCRALNELCCRHYNQHSMMTRCQTRRSSKEVFQFQPGDKIALGKNRRVINHEKILDEYIVEISHLLNDTNTRTQHSSKDKNELQKVNVSFRSGSSQSGQTSLNVAEVTNLFSGEESDLDRTVSELRERETEADARRKARRARAEQKRKEWKAKYGSGSHTGSDVKDEKKTKQSSAPNEEKLCNGEVFFIMDEKTIISEDNKSTTYFILSDRDPIVPRVVCVQERTLRKDCKMKHSWVRTIHTYQGSESDTVVYFLGPAVPQNWQHVYTAVTRGKKAVYIVGKQKQLDIAVSRQDRPRHSRLCQRLEEMLVGQIHDVKRLKSHLESSIGDHLEVTDSLIEDSDDSLVSYMPDPYFTQSFISVDSSPLSQDHKSSSITARNLTDKSWLSKGKMSQTTFTTENKGNANSSISSPQKSEREINSNHVTPPRKMHSSCDNLDVCSPSKQPRLNDISTNTSTDTSMNTPKYVKPTNTPVDTPFRNTFTETLSLDWKDEDQDDSLSEEPLDTSPEGKVKRSLF